MTQFLFRARYVRALCGLLQEDSASVRFKQVVCPRVKYGTEYSNYIIGLGLQILFYPKEFTTRVKSTAVTSTTRDLPAAEARAICGIISVLFLLTAVAHTISVRLLVNLLHRQSSDEGTEMKC